MFGKLVLGGIAAIALSGAALAADLPSRKAPAAIAPLPTFTWTGFYVGVNGGYYFGQGKASNILFRGLGQPGASFDTNGGLVGIQGGYNLQIDKIVLGVEADIDYADIKGSYSFPAPVVTLSSKLNYLGTVRARVGYAADRLLVFATGGVAYSSLKSTLAGFGATTSSTTSEVGYTVGGGLEYAVTNNWTVKGEYLYANFGKKAASYNLGGIPITANGNLTANIVRVGVNYKF